MNYTIPILLQFIINVSLGIFILNLNTKIDNIQTQQYKAAEILVYLTQRNLEEISKEIPIDIEMTLEEYLKQQNNPYGLQMPNTL